MWVHAPMVDPIDDEMGEEIQLGKSSEKRPLSEKPLTKPCWPNMPPASQVLDGALNPRDSVIRRTAETGLSLW